MAIPITVVDAFTDRPFAGNPAAVCLLDRPRPEVWLQDVAREMNLPETAFLLPEEDGFRLRWLSPAMEMDLCGHATLAAAHVLWERGLLDAARQARFFTRSGLLTAARKEPWIELDFPAEPAQPVDTSFSLEEILGVPAYLAGKNRMDYLVEVADEESVSDLQPDFAALARLDCRGVIVTSRAATGEYDFVSRFFAPGAGLPEDPVTGSAHCCLGPYWGKKLGKRVMTGYQASSRGGIVRVELDGDRVKLGGKAVTVWRGEMDVICES
jgi:PhzF family phenazine biosynthesis protein